MSSTATTETGCVSGPPEAARFPLLQLPRDLRERIYIAVLCSSAPSPSFPVSMEDRVPAGTLEGEDGGEHLEYCNMYHRFPLPTTTSALLTLNRQVHAEVKEVMSHKETTRPLIYKLDCMMVDERSLYPTWLSIPAISSNVDVVEANFRLFGDVKGGHSYWTPGNGGPGEMVWSLLGLLNRFLKRGPDFLSPPKPTGVKIGELVLNVVAPEEPLEGFISLEPHFAGPFRIKREGLIHPGTVVRKIEEEIGILLHSDEGNRVRKSVGIIRVCLDGEERQILDVSEGSCREIHERKDDDPGWFLKRRIRMRELADQLKIQRSLLKRMKRRLFSGQLV